MPKTLLQQAIEKQDVPAGTIQDKFNKGWLRLKRPKNTHVHLASDMRPIATCEFVNSALGIN